ncbi:hypothetical protein DQ04_11611000, partial [Trypanosoma grayi]|uniref:hypothetical protein n=1 Tax=Trypanosoma grayi TaxID=71804 RepID=UPI0004F45435
MALSLRDVLARPSDAEAMELLLNEYNKYCIGQLDDGGDISGDEEDVQNGTDDSGYYGLPVVRNAFNVRALSRVDFPRTWRVPAGTVPSACYTSAAEHGGTNTALLVDYSHTRCIVCVRSELLKPAGGGSLPQKVLAVWPDERSKQQQQQKKK